MPPITANLLKILGLLPGLAIAAESRSQAPLIFIHGFKGANLVNQAGDLKWLRPVQATGWQTGSLALPLAWKNPDAGPGAKTSTQETDGLHASGPLTRLRLIPYILEEDVYASWIKRASTWGVPYYSFAYDWRRSNLESLKAFDEFVVEIRRRHENQKVRVVAHSLGGLITLAELLKHPDYFESAVFAGVPFRGGIGFLRDMHVGQAVGWNSKILAPEVLFTYPAVYALYPADGSGLVDQQKKSLPMNFYEAADWKAKKLGIFADGSATPVGQPADWQQHLEHALTEARAFRALVGAPAPKTLPKILVVAGRSRPTLATVEQNGPKAVRGWDFESPPKVAGDGRVTATESLPEQREIPYELFVSDAVHAQLLNDKKVDERIRTFLNIP